MSEEKWATEMALKQMMKNPEDHKNFDKAQKSLRIINKERNNLNEKLDVIRSNKLISPDYCEWLVGAIINAERPQETNNDWFETDFSHAQAKVNDANLVVTDGYIVGVNTVGQSLKNPSYDLRAAPACPKFTVSPWQQSTIEPDFNIKNIME